MSDRDEIATAMSTVAGVNCTPYYRQSTKDGDGHVRIARMSADVNGFGYVTTWQVLIAIPQDRVSAEKWIEEKHPLIVQAMKRIWTPTTVTPTELVFDSAVSNGVIYEGTR